MEKLHVFIVSEGLPPVPLHAGCHGVVCATALDQAKTLFATKPVACVVVPPIIAGHSMTPFIDGFRRCYPKIPIIVYSKELKLSPYQDTHVFVLPPTRLHGALQVAEQILRERVRKPEDFHPCGCCAEACSLWHRRVMQYLVRDWTFLQVTSVREVAEHWGISEAYLDRAYGRFCSFSPKQLLLCLKLGYAAYLRESTTLGIEAIAGRCGFWDGHHLSRLFHQKVGVGLWRYPFQHSWQEVHYRFAANLQKKSEKVKSDFNFR